MNKEKVEFIAQAASDRAMMEFYNSFNNSFEKYQKDFSPGYAHSKATFDALPALIKNALLIAMNELLNELES